MPVRITLLAVFVLLVCAGPAPASSVVYIKDHNVWLTNPDGSGYTIIQAPGPVSSFDTVGVTREPAGGSQWPTSDRLLGAGI